MSFDRYIALGDSISIDLYPARDIAEREPASQGPPPRGLGAASLLYRNDDVRWPEFAGRDLERLIGGVAFRNAHNFDSPATHPTDNYATDGATTVGVLAYQLGRVEPSVERTLFTVTAGGNDMLQMMGAPKPPATLVEGMTSRLERIVRTARTKRPNSLVILGTVYDPSDGTNQLDGEERFDREAGWLAEYNDAVRRIAATTGGTVLADIHRHFLGHGVMASRADRWYWSGLIFEPNARGASEVRRLWLEALGAHLER